MYSIKNIQHMIKNNFGIFFVIILTLFVSFEIVFFSIGLFSQYSKRLEDSEIDSYAMGFGINESLTKGEVSDFIKKLDSDDISFLTCFSQTSVSGIDESVPVCFYLQNNNGKIGYSDYVFDNMQNDSVLRSGRFFTQKEFENGEQVAVIMGGGNEFQTTPAPTQNDTVNAFDKEYSVIGIIDPNNESYYFYSIYLPFNSLDEDTEITTECFISFNKKITVSQYNEIKDVISDSFGDKTSVYECQMDLKSNNSFYSAVIIIAVLTSVISTLNISIVYNYIILRRKRQHKIFCICGADTRRLTFQTSNEITALVLPTGVVSALIYQLLLVPLLSLKFPIINDIYNVKLYGIVVGIYFVLSYCFVLVISHINIKKSLAEV